MTSGLRYAKIFFIPLMLLAFGHSAFADTFIINFNKEATEAQKVCVFDVEIEYALDTKLDPDSAFIELSLTDSSYRKNIPLRTESGVGTATTTVTAPLPDKTRDYTFTGKLFMDPLNTAPDPSSRKAISTRTEDANCKNPTYTSQVETDAEVARQEAEIKKQNKSATLKGSIFSATSQNGGSNIQYGNKSFNIGGIGAALSGCLGIGQKITSQLGGLFGGGGDDSIKVDDSEANQKESCGDSLAYAASRIVIQNITKQSVNWATTGNNGNPYYPTDYKSLYSNIKSDQVKTFITQLQSAETSNPYSGAFAKSLATKARSDTQSFTDKYKYTGPDASFFKDKGGFNWEDWFKYLQPQNNSLGFSQLATKQIKTLEDQAVQTTREELSNNNGFLSQKVCDDKNFMAWVNDAEQAKNLAAAAKGDKAAIMRVSQSVCKNFKVATPGSIISKQLEQALGTPLRQAEQVDEVDEGVGAIFDEMVSKLVTKGLKNLSSTDFKNSVDFSYNAPTQNTGYDLPTGGSFWDEYKTTFDLRRDLPGIIKTQKAYVAQLEKNIQVLLLVSKSMDRLDYALPGPRIGWDENMSQRIYEAVSVIKEDAKLNMGGLVGNIASLGIRDKILDALEKIFLSVYTTGFEFYQGMVQEKFNQSFAVNIPKGSSEAVGIITGRSIYEQTLQKNQEEVTKMKDVIAQLEDINTRVVELYKRACTRFLKENPGSVCI